MDLPTNMVNTSEGVKSAQNVILIDNYDSFTWNIYQYLVLEGANVTVYRNDQTSLDELISINPSQLVISPGPGHPDRDSGISKSAIAYFSGKIPILGICMGQQCIYSVFGGRVEGVGEILHGKTSSLYHDGKGIYECLSQGLNVTRYHSLAGTSSSLPDCLIISAWTFKEHGTDKIIMGVRHRDLTIEGVQFHPESILTDHGRQLMRNFLKLQCGSWSEHYRCVSSITKMDTSSQVNQSSILEKIFHNRKLCVEAQKKLPGFYPHQLQTAYNLGLAPPVICFSERLIRSNFSMSLMAEIKRASPSKGVFSLDICAPLLARKYAHAGASVISVLTEPEWFKGTIEDLRLVRHAISGIPNRPAVLRKEFIFDEYQILEARLAGADSVLLIVKMLSLELLKKLYNYSLSLGMEPLVEVNNADEMKIAVDLKAKVIGVNNRNLTSFEVDLSTTKRLVNMVPEGTILCALSGITCRADADTYRNDGVKALLIGEALVRASNVEQFIMELLGDSKSTTHTPRSNLLVKICGTRSAEAAKVAVEAGADLIGIILVKGRTRTVSYEVGKEISDIVHSTPKPVTMGNDHKINDMSTLDYFGFTAEWQLKAQNRALLVGVFQNQPLDYILEQQRKLNLDVVQLHGREPVEWAQLIPVPVIRSFKPCEIEANLRTYHALPLMDSGVGGTGQRLDASELETFLKSHPDLDIFLAGGLNPNNITEVINDLKVIRNQIVGVDVSSGVEEDGKQSLTKIRAFISAAKNV